MEGSGTAFGGGVDLRLLLMLDLSTSCPFVLPTDPFDSPSPAYSDTATVRSV